MKKTLIIILAVILLIFSAAFLYVKTDMHIAFIDNYAQNFSDNLYNLRLYFEMKKAEKETQEETENNQNTPEEDVPQEQDAPAEQTPVAPSPEPTQKVNIAEPGKHDISEKDSIKITKTTKKDKSGESVEILTKKLVQSCDPIALNDASASEYSRFMDGVLCVRENIMTLYKSNGQIRWEHQTTISDPVLKTSDAYILIWENDGNRAIVYKNNKELYVIEAKDKILNGYISPAGECVLVSEKPYYKGEVKVYNKSGEEIYSRSFGSENVLSAAISSSRRLAISLMSIDEQVNSRVAFFDINKSDEDASITYQNTIIYDLEFSDNSLIAYADDKMISLKQNAKEDWVFPYNYKTLDRYQKDIKDNRLLMFDNQNNGELSVISLGGRELRKISTDIIPDYGDIYNGYIIYNDERNLYLIRLDGTLLAKYSASRDIHKAYFIDSDNILVVYNSSIEFLHTEKGE